MSRDLDDSPVLLSPEFEVFRKASYGVSSVVLEEFLRFASIHRGPVYVGDLRDLVQDFRSALYGVIVKGER